jgi:16S rRNA (cytosine967-C5)-methyltransferase
MQASTADRPIRLHPLQVRAVVGALMAIFKENKFADKVIEQALRQNPKAGSQDRAFIAESTYEIVRNYRLYTGLLGRVPVTEGDYWELAGIHILMHASKKRDKNTPLLQRLPDWEAFKSLKPYLILQKAEELQQVRAIRESIPDWLDELALAELGTRWEPTLSALNQPAPVVLRSNRLKTDRKQLQATLLQEGIETEAVGPNDALVLRRRQNVFQTKAFKSGLFEVQDYSSQQVAALLAPEPGMRVVDACAGGGGKTLHLAAMLQNRGQIIALDTLPWKLDALRLRARRAGATNIETRVIENRKIIKRLYDAADRLLLDVPCSGLGVLKRNPDSKWKLKPEFIQELRKTQQEILQSYSPILRSGGQMVYATCSILPSENRAQVDAFLASQAGAAFELLSDRSILPQEEGFDGFYMALLRKK